MRIKRGETNETTIKRESSSHNEFAHSLDTVASVGGNKPDCRIAG